MKQFTQFTQFTQLEQLQNLSNQEHITKANLLCWEPLSQEQMRLLCEILQHPELQLIESFSFHCDKSLQPLFMKTIADIAPFRSIHLRMESKHQETVVSFSLQKESIGTSLVQSSPMPGEQLRYILSVPRMVLNDHFSAEIFPEQQSSFIRTLADFSPVENITFDLADQKVTLHIAKTTPLPDQWPQIINSIKEQLWGGLALVQEDWHALKESFQGFVPGWRQRSNNSHISSSDLQESPVLDSSYRV